MSKPDDVSRFYRPMIEDKVFLLQVTEGCSYNRCKYCDMYCMPFAVVPHERVLESLDTAKRAYYSVPRVFLTGGNALSLPQDELLFTLSEVKKRFPHASVGSFARIDDVARKSDAELSELVSLGLTGISVGTETGYEPALEYMNKGVTVEQGVKQCLRLEAAGMEYNLFYLLGLGGKGRWKESAEASALFFGKLAPKSIMVQTLTVFVGTPLREEELAGAFVPAAELETLRELRHFVALYEPRRRVFLHAKHSGNVVPSSGYLPDDRGKLVDLYGRELENSDEMSLSARRSGIETV